MKHQGIRLIIAVSADSLATALGMHAGLVLDFEDLPDATATGTAMPSPYGAEGIQFNWGGAWNYAREAGNTYIFNSGPGDVSLQRIGGLFSYEGADFGLRTEGAGSITIQAWSGGSLVAEETLNLSATSFIFHPANMQNLDMLVFSGTNWRMDNFADSVGPPVVPEPGTVIAAALLLLPLGTSAVRILRKRG